MSLRVNPERLVLLAGRVITRTLLSRRWRDVAPVRALYTALYVFGKRLTERQQRRFLARHLRPGMVVVDGGANVGFYALQMAELVGPAGRVHAFEPDPWCVEVLRRRAARAAHGNVEVHAVALGEREGTATLYCGRSNRADNRLHPSHEAGGSAETCEVPVATLDSLCATGRIDRVDVLKLDVQGYEVAALRGFARTLASRPPSWMLLELAPEHLRGAGADPRELWQILADAGYEPWALEGPAGPHRIEDTESFARRWDDGYTDVWARRAGAGAAD